MAGSKLPFAPGDVRGRQMGNYEVLCRLSTGGMAEIFLATKRGLAGFHKPVVLKKILPDIQGQEEFVQMFLDEAKVTAAFNHPHIAQVFDLDVDEDELFLAMEFVPGATVIEVARACRAANEPMPVGFGLAAVRDTALALHYAHTFTDALGQPSPVIHRDVAEKNIMVTYEGVTKLLDFGIAKSLMCASRTAVGMMKGTSGYMSPEQILGEPLDARSDLFSLGVVLHECLTGMRLFPGKVPMAVVNAVLKGPIPEPSRANKAIPPELDAIVLKALARRREDRYGTTLEFARELERTVGPRIWLPEQSGELLRRLFAERREQTRQLLARGRAAVDSTGVVKLAQLFSDKEAPGAPPAPPPAPPAPAAAPVSPPTTVARPPPAPRLPTISAPYLPPPGPARPEETELVSYPVVAKPPASPPVEKRTSSASQLPATPPPPPEETNVHPPAQASSRARPPRAPAEPSTLPALPVLVEPPRPVRSPTPPEQTRAGSPARARSLSRPEAVPAIQEPKELDLKTAIIRPPRTPPAHEPPVTSDETLPRYDATRAARRPSLAHLDAITQPTGSLSPLLPGTPASARAVSPEGPTVPVMRAPLARPAAPVEPGDENGPEFLTAPYLVPSSLSAPTPMKPGDEDGPEFLTVPFLTAQPRSQARNEEDLTPAHPQPVARRQIPGKPREEVNDERTVSHTPLPAPARRGALGAALLLLLLVGGLATLVVLRLDGGVLSSRLFPTPRTEGSTPEPPPVQDPPAGTAPASTAPAEASASATTEAAAPEATSTSTSPESAPTPGSAPPPTEVATATGTGSPEVKSDALQAEAAQEEPEDEEPEGKAAESAQPAKRGKAAPSRRAPRNAATTSVESTPERVTTAEEADKAWQALERERAETTTPSDEKGSLTLVTEPYAKVYLGSRLVGETPLFRVPFAPGKHTLRLVYPNTKPLRLQVEIKAGEVTSIRTALDKLSRE